MAGRSRTSRGLTRAVAVLVTDAIVAMEDDQSVPQHRLQSLWLPPRIWSASSTRALSRARQVNVC
jgi:hypothetical protein